jgi:RNA-dependent RNA polymerase
MQADDPSDEAEGLWLMNFKLDLRDAHDHSGRLMSSAKMLLPAWGWLFHDYVAEHPVHVPYCPDWNNKGKVEYQTLKFSRDEERQYRYSRHDISHLKSKPYQDPKLEVEHRRRLAILDKHCEIMVLSFGFDFYENKRHQFVVEWEHKLINPDAPRAFLEFADPIHSIQILRGVPTSPDHDFIKIRYENVKEIRLKGNTIIFDLWTAPILEHGLREPDMETKNTSNKDFSGIKRSRLEGLDGQHRKVMSIFPKKFRVTLYGEDILQNFISMAQCVGLKIQRATSAVDTDDRLSESHKAKRKHQKGRPGDLLYWLKDTIIYKEISDQWLRNIDFPIAFQVSAILHNGLLNPIEICDILRPLVTGMIASRPSKEVADLLFKFSEQIPTWTERQLLSTSLRERFRQFEEAFDKQESVVPKKLKNGWFWSYRATVTPTTIRLDGPRPEQSNGIIRK